MWLQRYFMIISYCFQFGPTCINSKHLSFRIEGKYLRAVLLNYASQINVLGGDCSGLGGDSRPGDLGGLRSPQTVSSSSVILVYSVCMCIKIDDLGLIFCVEELGGKTLIFGSANVTVPNRWDGTPDAEGGGSDVSGSDWVCENWRRGRLTLAGWTGSSPI